MLLDLLFGFFIQNVESDRAENTCQRLWLQDDVILLCLASSTTLRRRSFAGRACAVHCISLWLLSSLTAKLELRNFHSGCHDRVSSLPENRSFKHFWGNSFLFERGLEKLLGKTAHK